ncbi:MAG: GGDEF domain-containing protein [Eubacteriales bacterium]|nr:GGDEF domain-containing protein [Eubacteriales bacterium]
MKKRYSIGVLIGGVHTYFPQQIIAGIRSAARELSMDVYFFLGTHTRIFFQNMLEKDIESSYDYQPNTIYDYSLISHLDGLIVNYGTIGTYLEKNDINVFLKKFSSLPTLVLTDVVQLPNCHYLISDNYHGIRIIMEDLICKHGYGKILYVGGPQGNTDAVERREAYLRIMKKYRLPVDDSMMAEGDYSEFVDEQVRRLLDLHPDAEALVFANDEMAAAGYRVCKERGLEIGKDIAITGFDNYSEALNMVPPLTTVSQDGIMMGRRAVFHLLDCFHGKPIRSERIPVHFFHRESCGRSTTELTRAQDIYTSFQKDRSMLTAELASLRKELTRFQRQSWYLPFLARNLNDYVTNEVEFCRQIILNLCKLSNRNMYLLLHEAPVSYETASAWSIPEPLYLAAYHHGNETVAYYPYDRPIISREHGIADYLSDEKSQQYTIFLLYSNDVQYGLLACDILQDEFAFFYVISLQLGLSLQLLFASKKEHAYLTELSQSMEMIRERNRQLDIISYYDELTTLLNLRGFMDQAGALCAHSPGQRAYMIYADLDHLKQINDTWGHQEGNYAIRTAGSILRSCLRDKDILGRIGGDEFAIMVLSEAEEFVTGFRERIRASCHTMNAESDKPFYVEITLGIVSFTCEGALDLNEVLSQADRDLYEHKKYRRKSVCREP